MTWQTNEAGDKKYVVSLYCKEELPTWDELYNEFYLHQMFQYDPMNPDHQSMDSYWKTPRRKLLMAWACNQLNKMIFEDGINVSKFLKDQYKVPFVKLHFVLIDGSILTEGHQIPAEGLVDLIYLNCAPTIYSCKIPSTKQPSIFQTKHPRLDIAELTGPIQIIAVASTDIGLSITTSYEFIDVLQFILKDVIRYFENGIGWKDDKGNILPMDPSEKVCQGAGFDPAL